MRSKDLLHLPCPFLLFPLPLLPLQHTDSPLPLPSRSLSHALTLSLYPCKLAQLSISPPAVPPAVCPPRTRNPTTIQVTGQEKEQAAFTMDQWRPVKQSLPFSPAASLNCCLDWKRQTFGEVAEEGESPLGQQPPGHTAVLTIAWRSTMINTLAHIGACTPHSIFAPRCLLMSRAIMSFNAVIKVKMKTFVIRWMIWMC